MKRRIVWIFVFIIIYNLYASPEYLNETFFYTDEFGTISILEDKIIFDDHIESGKIYYNDSFDSFKGNENNYIILHTRVLDSYFVYLIKGVHNTKYSYGSWEITYAKISKKAFYNRIKLVPFNVLGTESFITEKDSQGKEICFFPDGLFSVNYNPWAVKAENKKIIYVDTKRWRHPDEKYLPISEIVFVNGFVNPDKEYLYEQNSRAKRIRVSYNKTTFETELKDTGNFQVIHLPASINPNEKNNIKVEVLDYYPGTKYSDVVISGMYYMDATID